MRVLRKLLLVVLVLLVAGAGWASYLAATTPKPRDAEGWVRLTDMPSPRGEVASAVGTPVGTGSADAFGERLYVIGGIAGAGRTVRRVDVYDPIDDSWGRGPDLPQPRHHAGAVGASGIVFVTGGSAKATNWSPERTMWMLFANGSRWETGPAMPEGRMGHRVAAVGSRLYVIGGRGRTSNVLVYDISTRRWSLGAQMPRKRDHLGVAVVGTRIYAIGGRDDTLTSAVDIYDTVTDTWSEGPPLPEPMSAMAVARAEVPEPAIHVVGGEEPATVGGRVLDKHYVLRANATEWERAPLPIVATHGSAAEVLGGRLHVAGGARRQGSLSPLGWTGIVQRYGED